MNPRLRLGRSTAVLLVMLASVLAGCATDTGSTQATAVAAGINSGTASQGVSGTATGTISRPATESTGTGTAVARVGSATLRWQVPSTNSDGSALTNLAGFYIRYGTRSADLSRVVNIAGTEITQYVVQNLIPGTWYFIITSYTTAGVESTPSAMVSDTI